MTDKHTQDLKQIDFDLIVGFLDENFAAFSSYCEQRNEEAEQILSDLEKLPTLWRLKKL